MANSGLPKRRRGNGNKKPAQSRPGYTLIFRRYRTDANGKVLDAHDYGYRAWPIRVKR
jgi:hypothetical protein